VSDFEQPPSSLATARTAVAGWLRDSIYAGCFLVGWRPADNEIRAAVARGALWFPLLGAAGGALVAQVLALLDLQQSELSAIAPVVLLVVLAGARPAVDFMRFFGGGLLGMVLLLGVLASEVWAFQALSGNLRVIALVLAPMLGRWAYVVQAYGSLPARPDGFAAMMVRHMQFTQFATASVSAMALSLMLINALGTLVLFLVASLTILLRIWTHSRRGGVSAVSLGAGAFLCEAMVVVLIGAVARLAAGG